MNPDCDNKRCACKVDRREWMEVVWMECVKSGNGIGINNVRRKLCFCSEDCAQDYLGELVSKKRLGIEDETTVEPSYIKKEGPYNPGRKQIKGVRVISKESTTHVNKPQDEYNET